MSEICTHGRVISVPIVKKLCGYIYSKKIQLRNLRNKVAFDSTLSGTALKIIYENRAQCDIAATDISDLYLFYFYINLKWISQVNHPIYWTPCISRKYFLLNCSEWGGGWNLIFHNVHNQLKNCPLSMQIQKNNPNPFNCNVAMGQFKLHHDAL